MTIEHIKNRAAVIWDFDGVLYSYHTIPKEELEENFFAANARGAVETIPGLTEEEARRIGAEAFEKYHDTITGFMPFAERLGKDPIAFKTELLAAQLKWSYRNITSNVPELIEPCAETNDLFDRLQPHVRHIMVTHASAEHWARPVAQNLGVAHYFDNIFGYDDFHFKSKGESAYAVNMALETLAAKPAHAIFIEDQLRHLQVAKEEFSDLFTIFIEGAEPIEKPDYVDLMVKRPKNFLKLLLESKKSTTRSAA